MFRATHDVEKVRLFIGQGLVIRLGVTRIVLVASLVLLVQHERVS